MNYTQHITKHRKEAAQEYVGIVQRFIKKKYARDKRIDCQFDLYYHDVDNLRKAKHHKIVLQLPRIAYTQLLVVLLTYPDLTFQDLPVYIPRGLYDGLLRALYFPRYSHVYNLSVHPSHFGPVAVEMTTLQKDAREIAGEDMYSFLLPPSHQQGAFQELAVYLECRKMEIKVTHVKEDTLRFLTFSKIDAEKVQQLLHVSNFRGIETALNDMYNALPTEEQADLFWLIHWLDRNDLKYDYTSNEMK